MRNDSTSSARNRIAAVVEVVLAFACVHVAFRALKHFVDFGEFQNLVPGLVMTLFTVAVLLLCGRSFERYGLTWKRWRANITIGLFWSLALAGLAGLGLVLTRVHFDPSHPHNDPASRLAGAVYGLLATALLIVTFRRQPLFFDRVPVALSLSLVIALLAIALVMGVQLLTVLWLFFGAGFGEEIFFRGYIQSRVEEALGFGIGVAVSSLLFGLLHALNAVDYFAGRFTFAWWYGVQSLFIGLFYGFLRKKTGSILAGGTTHGLTDVLASLIRR